MTLASALLPPGVATLLAAAALSVVAVGVVARVARARQAFDRPSARRSHTVPTPRLGGVGALARLPRRAPASRRAGPAAGALEWGCTAFFLLGLVDDLRVGGHGLPRAREARGAGGLRASCPSRSGSASPAPRAAPSAPSSSARSRPR